MTYPATQTIIKLSRPYKFVGREDEVTELTMREPTVRDRLAHEKNKGLPLEKEVTFLAGLCALNPVDLYVLSGYDYDQLTGASNDFLLPPEERLEKEKENLKTNSSKTNQE